MSSTISIVNPVLQSAFENDWYYPATLDADITNHRLYEQAHTEGWHEWIETDLDFEAMKHGYVYDLSRDIEGKPIYWIDGGWQTGQGQRIDVRDEPEQIGYVGAGDAMMRFCETFLRFTKAPLVGKPYRYLPWNRKAVATMFGWVRHTDQTKVRRYRYAYICTGKKNSKALEWGVPVPTPGGWKNHGDLKVGDELFGRHGNICHVTHVHPKTEIDYEVEFTNGEVIQCNGDHLWVTETLLTDRPRDVYDTGELPVHETGCVYCGRRVYAKRLCSNHYQANAKYGSPTLTKKRVSNKVGCYYPLSEKTTEYIAGSIKAKGALNHRIPMHNGLDTPDVQLPIDPYILGYWLGDGTASNGEIAVGYQDAATFEMSIVPSTGYSIDRIRKAHTKSGNYIHMFTLLGFRDDLVANNLLSNKHIPSIYLRASRSQRLALLQGLLDSDGYISADGKGINFTQKRENLSFQVCELLASLGIKYSIQHKEFVCTNAKDGPKAGMYYHIQFHAYRDTHPVFRYERKLSRMRESSDLEMATGRSRHVHIKDVRRIDPVEGNCITVSSPDGTYLCGRTMIPTHNSYTVSSIADYMLVADGTPRGEVYVCACDRNQAGIIYREAVDMAQHGTLGAMVEPKESKSRLLYPENGSFLQVLAADAHRNDGVDSSAVLIDEIHRHPNRKLYDVMERSGMARPQPLLVVITTYGPSLTDGSIWAEIHNEARAQMNGDRPHSWRRLNIIASAEPITVTATANLQPGATRIPVLRLHQPVDAGPIEFDLSQFGETGAKAKVEVLQPAKRFQTHLDVAPIECEIPRFSEATANLEWCTLHGVKRANPSADVIFPAQDVLDIARDSRSPEKEAQTKQLNFNIVSGSGKRWLSSAVWRACGNLQVQPKSLIGRSAFVGFDFSFGGDLVGLGLAFPKWDISIPFIDVTNPRIDLLTWAWVPEEGIEEREKKEQFPYRTYAKQPYLFDDKGCIRICEGRVADFGQIVTEALEIFEMFNIVAIAYDPAYAQFAIPKFEEKGLTCVAHRQGAISMSPPVKRFQEMIYNGQIAHGNNPVLDRAVEGAELHPVDKAGNTYLSKGRSKNRIDALVAQVMAVGFATNPPVQQSGAYADASTGMWG